MKAKLVVAVLALALVHGSAALANDRDDDRDRGGLLYVSIDGVPGESKEKGHEGQFRAFRYSETWRLETITVAGGPVVPSKVTTGPVVFSKDHGPASVAILRALLTPTRITKATLEFHREAADGKTVLDYRITLERVLVVGINDRTLEGRLVDEVQLLFEKARWERFDPPDAATYDPLAGKSLNAPKPGAATR